MKCAKSDSYLSPNPDYEKVLAGSTVDVRLRTKKRVDYFLTKIKSSFFN